MTLVSDSLDDSKRNLQFERPEVQELRKENEK